ncbi:MAG TPA: dTMP kinase [Candidatus Limnocylindrales bacterium]|nr:dTMP kinase [Candidatus Limnocylindrales bacterium]
MRGLLLTLEGIEGSGKSTQAAALADALKAGGARVLLTREPGGVPLAETIRGLLLNPDSGPIQPLTELLLFIAARAEHVAAKIRPAIEAGLVVICDRFTDATLAYQGGGRSVPDELLRRLNSLSTGGLTPDRTYLIDVPVSLGAERADKRSGDAGKDRIERASADFFDAVRRRYLDLAKGEPERFLLLRGNDSIDGVARLIQEDAWSLIRSRALPLDGRPNPRNPT